jgi:hypothetical protein
MGVLLRRKTHRPDDNFDFQTIMGRKLTKARSLPFKGRRIVALFGQMCTPYRLTSFLKINRRFNNPEAAVEASHRFTKSSEAPAPER